jgi:hypothetical protein
MDKKQEQAKEGATYASEKYEKWAVSKPVNQHTLRQNPPCYRKTLINFDKGGQ